MKIVLAPLILICSHFTLADGPYWKAQTSGTTERLRGVSAVSANVAWASGNRGTILRTINGGQTWTAAAPSGVTDLDFRDIEGIDASTAYALSIGPGDRSRIYKTTDGGQRWIMQYVSNDPKAFLDAIAFWDEKNGLAMGDPVDGHFMILRTKDGGTTWTPIPASKMPPALPGEGAFAASGTCLVAYATNSAAFATGSAANARVFTSSDQGLTWTAQATPIAAGIASAGIFSIAFRDGQIGIAVGGDYKQEKETSDNLARTKDGGKTWTTVGVTRLRGFRSGVVFVPNQGDCAIIAVGPQGCDYSLNCGMIWTAIRDDGFHAISVDHSGKGIWAVGEQGNIAMLMGLLSK